MTTAVETPKDLMQAVRDIPKGTYAAGAAWVAYMRHAKTPNEGRRIFADMMRRHLKWPLSMEVAVKTPQGYLHGKVSGHLRDYPNKCFVDFTPNLVDFDGDGHLRLSARVPFRNIKKVNPK